MPAEAQDVRRPLRRSPKGARPDAERARRNRGALPLEGVCLKTRAFRGFRPGETRVARFPHQRLEHHQQLYYEA